MGHEFSGVVEEIGTGIPQDLKDKLVTANPFVSCGSCAFCRRGERQLCPERKIIGIDFPGAFAERIAVPYKSCYPITDPIRGALVEPLACAVRAIEKLGPTVGDSAVVFGAGTLGLMVTKLLDAAGVRELIVVDINATRLQSAKAWGATSTLNPNLQNIVESVKGQTIGGVDCIVDAVGSSETRRQSVECVRRGGGLVFLGLHDDSVDLPGNYLVRSEIRINGSFSYTDDNFGRSVQLMERNIIQTEGHWLDVRPLEAGQESFVEQTKDTAEYSKIILRP
jgi:threonine dehydrogenase-like Zn-dependent dehydrogenase